MRAALYLFSEKNETRWKAGCTISPSVTKWWLEQGGHRFGGLVSPPLPLYLAFFLHGKVEKRFSAEKTGVHAGDGLRDKIGSWIQEAVDEIDRRLKPDAKGLWERSKGKSFADGLLNWKPEWLAQDGKVLRSRVEGRCLLLEQVESSLDKTNRLLLGEMAAGDGFLGGAMGGGSGPTDVEWEERRALRRSYLPLVIQYLCHEGEIILTPGMAIVEEDKGYLLRCLRCSTEYRRWKGYPCGICEHEDMICEECSAMGVSKGCKPLLSSPLRQREKTPSNTVISLPSFLAWEGELTPAQKEASHLAAQFVQGTLPRTDQRELLIWAVTGAGKTEVVFQAVDAALRQGKRVLLATPRKDVVLELTPRFRRAFPTVPIVSLYGGSRQKGEMGELVIATTHQALNFFHAFQLVIIDEIDAYPFQNNPMLYFAVNRATAEGGKRILLTATPSEMMLNRAKKGEILQTTIPSRYHGHPLPIPTLRFEFHLEEKIRKGILPKGVSIFIEELLQSERQAFLFVPRIELVEDLVGMLRIRFSNAKELQHSRQMFSIGSPGENMGRVGEAIRGGTAFSWVEGTYAGEPLREEKVNAFRQGKIRLLVTTTILERGVTVPSIDVLVLMADASVFDESSLVQIAGRVGRSAKDPRGKVLFLSESRSRSMVKAVRQIEKMNREAAKRGFLVGEMKKNRLIRLLGEGRRRNS